MSTPHASLLKPTILSVLGEDEVRQADDGNVQLLLQGFFRAGVVSHLHLLDQAFVRVNNRVDTAAVTAVQRILQLGDVAVLDQHHFALLLFQNAGDLDVLGVLGNEHDGTTDAGETQNG